MFKMAPSPNVRNIPSHFFKTNRTVSGNMETDCPNASSLNLLTTSDRLRTFANWPVDYIDKDALAAAGFYYTYTEDIVRCPYCKIEVGHWLETDVPIDEHQRHSPNCRYILEYRTSIGDARPENVSRLEDESTRNGITDNSRRRSTVRADNNNASLPDNNGEDTCGLHGIGNNREIDPVVELQHMSRDTIMQRLNVNSTVQPIDRRYISYNDRLRTFANWPKESKLMPDRLSEAGFVYSGELDRTWCFHCGGTLHTWDEFDDPWIEHAHWFPNCKYVKFVKGQHFIDCARLRKNEDLSRTEEEIRNAVERFKELVTISDLNRINAIDNAMEPSSDNDVNDDEEEHYSTSSATSEKSESSSSGGEHNTKITCLCCLQNERNAVLIPCYHIVACVKCAGKLTNCCYCREPVIYVRKVFIP